MLRRLVLVTLIVLFTLASLGIGESLASENRKWQIAKRNGRLTVIPVDGRGGEESRAGNGMPLISIATTGLDLIGQNFPVSVANGDQYPASVAYNSTDNNYLAVWDDDRNLNSTGTDIYGQRISPTGDLIGNAIPIVRSSGDQLYPEVAYSSVDNEYLVIWYDDLNVYAQRLSNTAASLGSELFVADSSEFYRSSLVYNSQNNMYLVVSTVGEWPSNDIYGQLLSSAGLRQGNSFPICNEPLPQSGPVVAYNSVDNEYMVLWGDLRNTILIGDEPIMVVDSYAQLVSSTGRLIGGNFAVSSTSGIDWEADVEVAYNPGRNEYMIVWWDDRHWPDVDIYGRRVSDSGSPLGGSFSICRVGGEQWFPNVVYSSVGEEYLVVWEDERNSGLDIYGQHISDTGILDGPNFSISTARYSQEVPRTAYNSVVNEYLVVWTDERNKNTSGFDIYGQLIKSPGIPKPTPPIGLDSTTHTIEQWSGVEQITVKWDPPIAPGVDGYSILWDESDDTVPDEIKDLEETSTQTTSPALGTGDSYWFHIRTVNSVGDWSDEAAHLGPFFIDMDMPLSATNLESSTHNVSKWSSASVVMISWNPATDLHSGLRGYSYLWDRSPDTSPEHIQNKEADATEADSPALTTGTDHYFHISAVDNVGNWENTAHLGPFFIDVDPPSIVTSLTSTTHTVGEWSSDGIVGLSWEHAPDVGSGVKGYSVVWDTTPDTLPGEIENVNGTETESPELADGTDHYCHIRSVDNVGNWSDDAEHIGPFWIDTIPPTLATDLSGSPPPETCSADTIVQVMWTAATDQTSGLQGYSVEWDNNPDTLPDDMMELGPEVTEYASPELPNGKDHYCHIRSIDNVGNASDEAAHIGPFYIGTPGPDPATDLVSTSHVVDIWSNIDIVDVQWTPAVGQCGVLDGYSLVWDDQPDTLPDDVKDVETDVSTAASPALPHGASYFHIRAVDDMGNWSDEAAHLGPFPIDLTNPSEPTALVSATHTPGAWSAVNIVGAAWEPAQDVGSGLGGYSIVWDRFAETLPDDTMELGPDVVETASEALSDGNDHYVHIRSVDQVGNWYETAAHLGPFQIDTTLPAPVTDLTSTSHQVEICSPNTMIQVMWASATDEGSGLQGYSVVWDTFARTLPDDIAELGAELTEYTSPELVDGKEHYFHIRSIDNVGNASAAAVHLGPFYIDTTGPGSVADLQSVSHQVGVWSNKNAVNVQWTHALDDCGAVDGYSIVWDTFAETLTDDAKDIAGDVTTAASPALADGENYFHIRSVDDMDNWSNEAAHLGPFSIDLTKPSEVADLVSPTHLLNEWSANPVVGVSWTPAVDETSGLQGYSALWDTFAETLPDDIINLGADITEAESEVITDGDSHYFHIRSVDNAGNWSDTAVHIGPFWIDTIPPALVADLSSISHELETCSPDTVVQMMWTPATDEGSGVQGYSVVWDTFADTLPDDIVELGAELTEHASPELPDGKNHYFHIRSIDNVGNVSNAAVHLGPFYIDTTGSEMVTDLQSTSHHVDVWSEIDTVDVKWTPAVDECGVVDGYSISWDGQPDTLPDDVKDIAGDANTATSPALANGANYVHIRGVDNLGNWSGEAAHLGPFLIDVTRPPNVTDLASPTHLINQCSPINVITVSWIPAVDEHSGLQGYSALWDTLAEALPDDIIDLGSDITEVMSEELADGDSHYLHIRSVDNVGNWGETAAHIGPFYVDTLAPTMTVSPLSHELGVWSNENVVTVGMSVQDELCGAKGYSVVWNENSDTEPEEVQNTALSESIDSPELADGEWYLHAKPVDNSGNWGITQHLGPFRIDTNSIQGPVNVASDTHVPEVWSPDTVVGIGWTSAFDGLSGLKGYSIVWDDQPDTIPDTVTELGADAAYSLSPEFPDGDNRWFHIRAIDNAGNGDKAGISIGPFYIDANSPEAVTDLACISHEMEKWSTNNVLEFIWGPAVDMGQGLDGYAVVIDDSADTIPDTRNLDSEVTEFSNKVADGEHYIHIRPVDKMGFWGETEHSDRPLMIDTTSPPAPVLTSAVGPGVWSNQNAVSVSLKSIIDDTSGLDGYSFSWASSPDNKLDLGPGETIIKKNLADGTHNLRIKAADKAGNWSNVVNLGPFRIDTTPPRSVKIYDITEDNGVDYIHIDGDTLYSSALGAGSYTVYVTGTDSPSGLKEALFSDATSPGDVVEAEATNSNYSYSYQYQVGAGSGFNGQVSVSLFDKAGNSATTNFNVSYDSTGPHKPVDVKCDDGAKWNTTGEVKVTWSGEGDDGSGVANYYVEAENIEPQENPDDGSMSVTIPVDDGEAIKIYVRGIDNVGNWGIAGSATVSVDTKAPGDVQEIAHVDSDANEGFDNDKDLEFSWESATDNIKVDHYEVHRSVDGGAYELLESVDDEEYTVTGEDGKNYKVKVMAVDPAGNKGPATESEEIVCDMSEPEFIVSMLPNPGFQNFIDIVVISLETLQEELPTLSVELNGKQEVTLDEITDNVWVGSYTIPEAVDGEGTVVVKGTDMAGNVAEDKSKPFTAQTVLARAPARIQSADGKLALNIPADTLDRDTTVVMMAVALDEKLLQNLGTAQLAPGLNAETGRLDELEAVGQHYLISPGDAKFMKTATLTLQYEDTADVNAKHLGVYIWDSDAAEWKYADSVVDERTRSIRAQVKSFGTFGLYTDTKAPQIAHISPSDGAVLDTAKPEFAIGVSDKGSGVNLSSLSLLIDDQMVNVSRKTENEVMILTLEHGLTAGDHTFSIVGADMAGNDFASIRRSIRVPEWAVIPASSQLLQNYPNPFNPETWIPYRLSESADVRVSIYSLSGKLVKTLELGTKRPGMYTDRERAIHWDGRNESGETVSSGIYFYHLSAGDFTAIRKMAVAR